MRRPRRRCPSAWGGTGALETQGDIENGGERRERIPLQRVAAMPFGSGIGTLPYPHQTVGGIARLLDHEGLQAQPQLLLLARENEVLAHRTGRGLGSELQESGTRDHCLSSDRLKALGSRDAG